VAEKFEADMHRQRDDYTLGRARRTRAVPQRCGSLRRIGFVLCALVALAFADVHAGAADSAATMVSINVDGQPLGDALDQLRDATGFEVTLTHDEWRSFPVTARVEGSSPKQVLRDLLRDFNYTIVEQDDSATLDIRSAIAPPAQSSTPDDAAVDSPLDQAREVVIMEEGAVIELPPVDVPRASTRPRERVTNNDETDLRLLEEVIRQGNAPDQPQ
jgi:hypothetical protein